MIDEINCRVVHRLHAEPRVEHLRAAESNYLAGLAIRWRRGQRPIEAERQSLARAIGFIIVLTFVFLIPVASGATYRYHGGSSAMYGYYTQAVSGSPYF